VLSLCRWVLARYIRSLNHFSLPVQHFLYELVINLLVRHNRYYQLHQFLQYHVVNDSKHVACLLLSLEGAYAPAFQLALDMLKRLHTANEDIFDVGATIWVSVTTSVLSWARISRIWARRKPVSS
jgi:hypothetical protein